MTVRVDTQAAPDEETIRMALTPCRDEVDEDALDALGRLAARLEAAETALWELAAKPYRAEEVVARYFAAGRGERG